MATKPTIALARWADQIGANLASPSSGLRDLGFQQGTAALSGIVNTELNELYKWVLYLNDGALSGNHTIAGTLGVSSALTVTAGGLTVSAGGAAITGNSAVTGTLGVSGTSTQAAINASGLITANGSINVPTTKTLTLTDGMSALKYGATNEYISGIDFVLDSGSATRAGHVWTFPTTGTNDLVASFHLAPGTRISNVVFSLNRNSNNISGEFDLTLTRRSFGNGGTTTSSVSSGIVSSGTGWTTHDLAADSGLPHDTVDAFYYELRVRATTTFSGAPSFDGVKLVLSRP